MTRSVYSVQRGGVSLLRFDTAVHRFSISTKHSMRSRLANTARVPAMLTLFPTVLLAFGARVQWRPYTSTGPNPLAASRSAVAPENPAVARGGSRFFLDTADAKEWEALLPLGMFHGVTTNPTLLERSGIACTVEACRQLAVKAGALGVEEIMFQAWGTSTEEMVETGLRLASIEPARVTVKVPVTAAGTSAAAELVQRGVRVCLTACYGREQALVAASVGAEYLAPYLGRMDDAGKDGMAECRAMQATACEHACIRAPCAHCTSTACARHAHTARALCEHCVSTGGVSTGSAARRERIRLQPLGIRLQPLILTGCRPPSRGSAAQRASSSPASQQGHSAVLVVTQLCQAQRCLGRETQLAARACDGRQAGPATAALRRFCCRSLSRHPHP